MKLKELFNKAINKKNKQISFSLKKKEAHKCGVDIDKIFKTDIEEFLK